MKKIIIIITAAFLVCLFYRTYRDSHIDSNLDTLLKNGAVILDVRTQAEFESGHIPGAVNRSLSRLRQEEIVLDTGKTYVTCCSHGLRSIKAVKILKERGYRHVYNGGAWTDLQSLTDAEPFVK